MRRRREASVTEKQDARQELAGSLARALEDTTARNDLAWAQLEKNTIGLMQTMVSEAAASLKREDVGWTSTSGNQNDTSKDYTYGDLVKIRRNCRQVWRHDGTVCNAERLLLVGSIGKGIEKPKALTPEVQAVVDRLWKDVDNQRVLFGMQALERANLAFMLDGEVFFAVHTNPGVDATVKLSLIDPDEITEIIPHPDNKDRTLVYQRTYHAQTFDWKSGRWATDSAPTVVYYRDIDIADPADIATPSDGNEAVLRDIPNLQQNVCIMHVPVNTVGKRGVPLVARAVEWVKAYHGCITDLVNLAKALSAIAWYKKVKSRNQEAINASSAQMTSFPAGAGGVHVANESVDMSPVNVGVGGVTNLSAAMREIYLVVLRCFGFGEHWYCEANTGNLATAQAMELPALWMLTRWQNLYRSIIDRIVEFAVMRGVMLGEVKDPDEVLAVQVDFPSPEPRNDGALPNTLLALDQARSSGLLLPFIASSEAYNMLGVPNPTELLSVQYPDGIKTPTPEPTDTSKPDAPADTNAKGGA